VTLAVGLDQVQAGASAPATEGHGLFRCHYRLSTKLSKGDVMKIGMLVLGFLLVAAPPVSAAPYCGPQTTRGYWEFTCDGYLTPPPPAPAVLVPSRLLGTCTASKTAYWDCEGTVNLGGTILEQELHGQAINASDCTGTITYTQTIFGQPAPDLNVRYVIRDDGATINGLPVDSGQVLSCVLHRISVHAQ
jgi:hypothetical protein